MTHVLGRSGSEHAFTPFHLPPERWSCVELNDERTDHQALLLASGLGPGRCHERELAPLVPWWLHTCVGIGQLGSVGAGFGRGGYSGVDLLAQAAGEFEEHRRRRTSEEFRRVPWGPRDQEFALAAFQPEHEDRLVVVAADGRVEGFGLEADAEADARGHDGDQGRVGGTEQAQGEPNDAENEGDTRHQRRGRQDHLQELAELHGGTSPVGRESVDFRPRIRRPARCMTKHSTTNIAVCQE